MARWALTDPRPRTPSARVVNVKGRHYGTTLYGGANGDGTVCPIGRSASDSQVEVQFLERWDLGRLRRRYT
jgi:hypothetical protein